MTIAISAREPCEFSPVDRRGVRAPFFLLFGDDGHFREAISNPFARGVADAPRGVAELLAAEGVDLLMAGHCGQGLHEALEAKSIAFVAARGAADTLMKQRAGGLAATGEDAPSAGAGP